MNRPNPFPDFFVVGTVKAGTTSLYSYLKQHPDVFVPAVKELHFFAREINPERFIRGYGKNDNAHIRFVKNEQEYLHYYRDADKKLKGDFAPSNLWSAHAAREIHNVNPNAKIIALVRQPVERAFSHWLMDLKNGWAKDSFVSSFEHFAASPEKHWGNNRLYKELSLYTNALQRYYDVFPPDQILVVDFDELTQNALSTFEKVLHFLELPPHALVETEAFNRSAMPRYGALDAAYQNKTLRRQIRKLLPAKAVRWMKQTLLSSERVSKLSPNDRKHLMPHFEKDIERLGVMLNRDFNHWFR